MAITADQPQGQKQKRDQDSHGTPSNQRSQKGQRNNQNPRANWTRDQDDNKGHTTKYYPETEKTKERIKQIPAHQETPQINHVT